MKRLSKKISDPEVIAKQSEWQKAYERTCRNRR